MDAKVIAKLEFDKIVSMLADMAESSLGKEIAHMLQPSSDVSTVDEWLKETDDALLYLVKKGRPPLGGIRDIRESIRRAEIGGILDPGELLSIADVLRVSRFLKTYMREDVVLNDGNKITEMISRLTINRALEDDINTCIVSEDEISDDASAELKTIRRQIKDLQAHIKERLDSMVRSSRMQKYMQESIVTIREDRYVIPVKSEYKNEIRGLIHDSSASGATVYIEPAEVVEANNRIKQMKIKEKIEIERILSKLTAGVCDSLEGLKINVNLLGRIDFAFAKAKLSIGYECSRPSLNTGGIIRIKKGRHPLIKKEEVVPIDLWIGEEFKSLVITGPNTGGKTVTLKTVGLFTLMTQAGLHIPAADGSVMCVYKNVFADIGDEQSIEQSLSTFSSHMTNIVQILEKADERSLVLLDELGAGTDPTEGAALAMAIINVLYRIGATTISTTHYSELKAYAVSTSGVENASCEFDIKTLRPTYRLLIGVPGKSNAFAISQKLGMRQDVLELASEFLTQENIRFEDVILSLENDRAILRDEREKAEMYRRKVEQLSRELEKRKAELERQKNRIIREAKEEARRILLEAKKESDNILKQLIEMKQKRSLESNAEAEQLRNNINKMLKGLEKDLYSENIIPSEELHPATHDLKPGDSVIILSLNQEGTVLTPPDRNGDVAVQAGVIKINANVSQLAVPKKKPVEEKPSVPIRGFRLNKSVNVSMEIDVRGSTVEEAKILTDKFIDDASLAGLKEVMVIHGKGSGALRSGLHAYLKSNPHVSSFRLGEYGEGDTGVTIVRLK